MIEYIKGNIIEKQSNNTIIIENLNIGFKIFVDTFTYNKLQIKSTDKIYGLSKYRSENISDAIC